MEMQQGHEKDKFASSFSSERESKRGRGEVTDEIIINYDELEEIMLRLPVKSLILVSKPLWKKKKSIVLVMNRSMLVSKSVDGLFCFYAFDLKIPIKVMNRATKWSLTIPLARIQLVHSDNKVEFSLPGFGKDYVTGTGDTN
ncbi:unnamed protein product [Brassica oleracea var. botrytis]|uniref:(rape) hypothetical protein n=1 Tax=Brassica napus TaxID=3708 RepID=A0A816KCM0_BRANA|nr:unnamed protein product [Brassica napus]